MSTRKGWLLFLLSLLSAAIAQAGDYSRPKVRAVTAFVRLERNATQTQIAESLRVLRATRSDLQKQG